MTRGKRATFSNLLLCFLQACAVAFLVGCATTYVQPMLEYEGPDQLQPPSLVLIHNFLAPPDDDSPDQPSSSESEDTEEMAQEANHELCTTLIEEMEKLGLAAQSVSDPIPTVDTMLSIEGEFLCLEEGSSIKRMFIGFGAGAAQVNTIVRIYLHSGNRKELLQEFMATAETSDKTGLGPAMIGMGPVPGGGIIPAAVSSGISAASETWGSDIEALSDTLAKAIVKSLLDFSTRQGWTTAVIH